MNEGQNLNEPQNQQLNIADVSSMCFFPKTKELLETEIKKLTECRDGVGKAWNLLKRDGVEDDHLRTLYNNFDSRLKEYNLSIGALMEETRRNCACS